MTKLPKVPDMGDTLKSCFPSDATLELLSHRRSTKVIDMGEPGPSSLELEKILEIAARVPDHRKKVPFRFVLFDRTAKDALGDILAQAFAQGNPDIPADRVEFEQQRLYRAPTVLAVVSSPKEDGGRTPVWEQYLTCGAVCQNLLLAASAMGYAGQWLTEWYSYHNAFTTALHLAAHEKIAGIMYLGTATIDPIERARPEISEIISVWRP